MAYYLQQLYHGYTDLMENKSDQRVKNWFMMSSPLPTMVTCLSYVYFVKVLGPRLMENRKPFDLKRIMLWYNIFQVVFSAWLFTESLRSGWWGHYSFRCEPVDYSDNPMAMRMARGCWWYYISKFVEFLDTIFFVLRKKNDHVSTLHVIHHGIMPMSVWWGVKFTPGGHSTFFGLLNTFVHVIMYTYYLLASFGPKLQPYLWWKKYLTALQMVQFIVVMLHAFQLLFVDCNYPKAFVWWIGLHAVMFFYLFRDFYRNTYKQGKSSNYSSVGKMKRKSSSSSSSSAGAPPPPQPPQPSSASSLTGNEKQEPNRSGKEDAAAEKKEMYANQYKMATGYISDSGLRNRVFIDNRGFEK